MDFRILEWISGFQSGFQIGFLDFRLDFWISQWISGFLDFTVDFWISVWISADGVRDFFHDGPLARNTCIHVFFSISEKLEVLSELVNPISVTNQTFIMKHRPVAPGWRVSRTSVAMCTCTRVGHNLCNPNGLLLSFMSTHEF